MIHTHNVHAVEEEKKEILRFSAQTADIQQIALLTLVAGSCVCVRKKFQSTNYALITNLSIAFALSSAHFPNRLHLSSPHTHAAHSFD